MPLCLPPLATCVPLSILAATPLIARAERLKAAACAIGARAGMLLRNFIIRC
jgi:hypothetical protein